MDVSRRHKVGWNNCSPRLRIIPYADGFLGELLLMKGDVVAATAHFEAATRLNPKWAMPWVHLARAHYAQKQTAKGDAALRKGLAVSPENEQMRFLLGMSLSVQRRSDEAIEQYESVLQRSPSSILAANDLAAILVDHKVIPRAWSGLWR